MLGSSTGPTPRRPAILASARSWSAATRALIDHLVDVRGLDRQEAYALCSVAADLRIHEVVDVPNWLVGAFLPDDIFTGGGNR